MIMCSWIRMEYDKSSNTQISEQSQKSEKGQHQHQQTSLNCSYDCKQVNFEWRNTSTIKQQKITHCHPTNIQYKTIVCLRWYNRNRNEATWEQLCRSANKLQKWSKAPRVASVPTKLPDGRCAPWIEKEIHNNGRKMDANEEKAAKLGRKTEHTDTKQSAKQVMPWTLTLDP